MIYVQINFLTKIRNWTKNLKSVGKRLNADCYVFQAPQCPVLLKKYVQLQQYFVL